MATTQVDLLTTVPDADLVKDARAVYAAAFARAPYHESPEQAAEFDVRVSRYATRRDGFRLAVARGAGGQLTGVALAVLGRPGDWWRDRAAAALGEPGTSRWLGDECLEVVHVAVLPSAQRQGVGRMLHDALISGRPAPTGALSCHPQAVPAQRLYLERGWRKLTGEFRAGDGPACWLMARDL